jgi:hypothetical protein
MVLEKHPLYQVGPADMRVAGVKWEHRAIEASS